MEKISGIVKASPRLTSVDLSDAPPVRPGTPGFGRPQGVSSLAERNQESSIGRAAERGARIQSEMMDWRSKDSQRAAIAAELSDKFFIKNKSRSEQAMGREELSETVPVTSYEVASKPAGFKTGDLRASGQIRDFDEMAESDELTVLQQPEGLFPKGSFIDRRA